MRTIRGAEDSFHRLRVGDYRVMYELISEDRVLHVLGIVYRGDLAHRLRSRGGLRGRHADTDPDVLRGDFEPAAPTATGEDGSSRTGR